MRNLHAFTRCTVHQALATVTEHPARMLGLESTIGCLREGAWGDIVLLERDTLAVAATYVGGQCVWGGPSSGGDVGGNTSGGRDSSE